MAAAAALVAMGGSAGRSEQGGEGRGGRRRACDANEREESRARVRRGCRSRHGVVVAASDAGHAERTHRLAVPWPNWPW